MTKSAMDFWDTCYLGPAMLFFNQYFNCWLDEYLVLWLCLVSLHTRFFLLLSAYPTCCRNAIMIATSPDPATQGIFFIETHYFPHVCVYYNYQSTFS